MLRTSVLLILLALAGCSRENAQGNAVAPVKEAAAPASGGALTGLTGLYEGGEGQTRNQLCMVEGGEGARFGLVVWGGNMHSCSGIGSAKREGDTLRLSMTGDETCTIAAKIDGKTITLPNTAPEGCAYYCGARARLSGASFTQVGTSKADALKAKDLVGESLCQGM